MSQMFALQITATPTPETLNADDILLARVTAFAKAPDEVTAIILVNEYIKRFHWLPREVEFVQEISDAQSQRLDTSTKRVLERAKVSGVDSIFDIERKIDDPSAPVEIRPVRRRPE